MKEAPDKPDPVIELDDKQHRALSRLRQTARELAIALAWIPKEGEIDAWALGEMLHYAESLAASFHAETMQSIRSKLIRECTVEPGKERS